MLVRKDDVVDPVIADVLNRCDAPTVVVDTSDNDLVTQHDLILVVNRMMVRFCSASAVRIARAYCSGLTAMWRHWLSTVFTWTAHALA